MAKQHHDETPAETPAIPGYRTLGLVGQGAYGQVWMAEETLTGLRRGLKVLPKVSPELPLDPARELAGIREYQQKSKDHPSVIQIYHVDETADCYYYAMELADNAEADDVDAAARAVASTAGDAAGPDGRGGVAGTSGDYHPLTLETLIKREAPMPPERALDILAQVVRGLDHLHTSGLLHRDVKPSNVLVVDRRIKLADVGLVTTLDRDVTQIGTPGYMPPDATLDQTADLYAAGIMLYEMITGLPRSRFPELPVLKPRSWRERRDLRAAIHIANRAAHPDRRQRYGSAKQLLRDVAAGRARDPRRRKRIVVGAALVCIMLALAQMSRRGDFVSANILPQSEGRVIELHYKYKLIKVGPFPSPVNPPLMVDFAGDGRRIVAVGTKSRGDKPGRLIGFDPADPTPALTDPLYDEYLYKRPPWEHQKFSPPCNVFPILAADLNGVPGEELLVRVAHDDCPTRWIVFTRDFRSLGEYWHYGHVTNAKQADLDGDGLPELICWGIANERGSPLPFGAKTEPGHCAIMILDPRRFGSGQWSMNDWMNHPAKAPLAYGYVKHAIRGDQQSDWYVIARGFIVNPDAPIPIRLTLGVGLMLELDRELNVVQIRGGSMISSWEEPVPAAGEVWQRLWPRDDEPVKDSSADGE